MDLYVGEMDADQLSETTMNKDNRILKQINIKDLELTDTTIKNLMGKDVNPRKTFISERGNRNYINI